MGQKHYKNFCYPKDCINVNTIQLSNNDLVPQGDTKRLLVQADAKLQTVIPKKLAVPLRKLTFLTYNVWFEYFNEGNRVPCLLKLLETSQADFICLQEVTADFMKYLLQAPWLSAKYHFSGYAMSGYNCLLLSKLPCNYYRHAFKYTGMGRSLFVAETEIDGEVVAVATAHFESLDSADIRKDQLAVAFSVLDKYSTALLMGDFNFDSSWNNEEKVIPKEYTDVWVALKGTNAETMPKTKSFKEWRPDRILIKSKKWKPVAVGRVGDFTIPPYEHEPVTKIQEDGHVRTPSDHFGLTCMISSE